MSLAHRPLAPAPPKPPPAQLPRVTFFDLPAELRIEVYKLALEGVVIHILPTSKAEDAARCIPHALTRTSRQVRNEVLPMIHSMCPIRCSITDFNFDGLLLWIARIPPDQESKLCKNEDLRIQFATSGQQPPRSLDSLRKWLHMRADKHRPQPKWQYYGPQPHSKICADLRRRAKRMTESGKQEEMLKILKALNIDEVRSGGARRQMS
ncbi:hypothetical protein PRZ48_004759 [Zasmidium cellare]|uniref:Uncharacterized protein n=1 Tax=Zasmidium cellare TaxID=395010 RepID=A0ABR0EQI0_ZASCE|nr:hypothetical protein PRZ48_004759 [Zasmidium cellare]